MMDVHFAMSENCKVGATATKCEVCEDNYYLNKDEKCTKKTTKKCTKNEDCETTLILLI